MCIRDSIHIVYVLSWQFLWIEIKVAWAWDSIRACLVSDQTAVRERISSTHSPIITTHTLTVNHLLCRHTVNSKWSDSYSWILCRDDHTTLHHQKWNNVHSTYELKDSPWIPHTMWIVTWEWALLHFSETGPVNWSWTFSAAPVSVHVDAYDSGDSPSLSHSLSLSLSLSLTHTHTHTQRLTCDLLCTSSSNFCNSSFIPQTNSCVWATVW